MLSKCDTKFHATSTTAVPRGSGSQSLLLEKNKCVRDNPVSGTFVLLNNNTAPLIVTHEARISPAPSSFTPTAVVKYPRRSWTPYW